jgi:hypothetical protein
MQDIASALGRAAVFGDQAHVRLTQFAEPVAGDEMNETARLKAFVRLSKTKNRKVPMTRALSDVYSSGSIYLRAKKSVVKLVPQSQRQGAGRPCLAAAATQACTIIAPVSRRNGRPSKPPRFSQRPKPVMRSRVNVWRVSRLPLMVSLASKSRQSTARHRPEY